MSVLGRVVPCVRSVSLKVLYANVKKNDQGEILADQLIEWLYGEGQGAKMLPSAPHLEVPRATTAAAAAAAAGGDSPSAKSGSFSPRHCRTEQDVEKFGILTLGCISSRIC